MDITGTRHTGRIFAGSDDTVISYDTNLKLGKFSLFGQVSKSYLDESLKLSLGVRTDVSTYSKLMSNPLHQFSPRFRHLTRSQRKTEPEFQHGPVLSAASLYCTGLFNPFQEVLVNKE